MLKIFDVQILSTKALCKKLYSYRIKNTYMSWKKKTRTNIFSRIFRINACISSALKVLFVVNVFLLWAVAEPNSFFTNTSFPLFFHPLCVRIRFFFFSCTMLVGIVCSWSSTFSFVFVFLCTLFGRNLFFIYVYAGNTVVDLYKVEAISPYVDKRGDGVILAKLKIAMNYSSRVGRKKKQQKKDESRPAIIQQFANSMF